MLPRRVDVVDGERAAGADVIRARRQHEVVDGELAAAAEQVAERALAVGSRRHRASRPSPRAAAGARRAGRRARGSWRAPWRAAPCGRRAIPRAKRSAWFMVSLLRLWVAGARAVRPAGGALQPGRQVEEAHQQVHRGHAVDRQRCPPPRCRAPSARRIGRRDRIAISGEGRRGGEGEPAVAPRAPGCPSLGRWRCHSRLPFDHPFLPLQARAEPRARRGGGESDKCDGISMDSLITAAARALAAGDPLAALKRVALRDDPPALALRGIAMAQLGDLARAKELLRSAARGFGPHEATARARCVVAEAEIALVSRDLGGRCGRSRAARATLAAHGDRANAAPCRLSRGAAAAADRAARRGRAGARRRSISTRCRRRRGPGTGWLPPASRCGASGRRRRAPRSSGPAQAARATGIPALVAEVDRASRRVSRRRRRA